MKKQLLFTGLLVALTLIYLANHAFQENQTDKIANKAFFNPDSNWKEAAEIHWSQDAENKTGRQIIYFWEEQV